MKFLKGIDHVLPIEGENVVCKEGLTVPEHLEKWFKTYKPDWVTGGKGTEEGALKSPKDKMVNVEMGKKK